MMKQRTNKLINDIMTHNNSCVLLIAEPGRGKTEMLTELGSRYKTVFWFDAKNINMSIFLNYLIDQVVDNPEAKNKLCQFVYCKSEYNGYGVIIAGILDYIASIKNDCLMVFERMEDLPHDFDISLIERLIKHCPQNLKIVISSDKYINLDYTKFEPKYPKIIDETDLERTPDINFTDYFKDLNATEIAFLIYLSDLNYFNLDFVESLFKDGAKLIQFLCSKDYYIIGRGKSLYRFNKLLKEHLQSIKDDYKDIIDNNFQKNVIKLYADHLMKNEIFLEAFVNYYLIRDYDKLDECVKNAILDETYQLRGTDFALSNSLPNLESRDDKLYYSFFYAIVLEGKGEYDKALNIYEKLASIFKEQKEVLPEIICLKRHHNLCTFLERNDLKLKQQIIDVIVKNKDDYPDYIALLFTTIIEYRRDLNKNLYELERDLLISYSKNTLYVKNMETLAHTYFDAGNYKRAFEIACKLREYIPFYVIPHNFVAFLYFTGDVAESERLATEALNFATNNDITKDISLLYSSLGMVDLYFDKIDDAIEKFDKSVRMDNGDFAKFHNICIRCVVYAKYRDANYAKEIALIYLKYCENFKPKYKNVMQIALAFAYLKLNEPEKAYDYATKCVQSSKSRTTNWFLGMAIATSYMLVKGDLKDAITLVTKLFRASSDCGLDMLVVDFYYDVFDGMIKFAKMQNIESDYIQKIEEYLKKKAAVKKSANKLRINMFGETSVYVNETLVKWRTKKSKDLFMHYILAGDKGVDRNIIMNYLWKDYLYDSAINNLKTTNNIIRNTLAKHNIKYKLDYFNCKYVLTIDNIENDYVDFCRIKDDYHEDMPLSSRIKRMNAMLKLYSGDLAIDVQYPDFAAERKSIKQELVISLLKLIRYLAKQNDFLEAKRFLSVLENIDKNNNYQNMLAELDSHVNILK